MILSATYLNGRLRRIAFEGGALVMSPPCRFLVGSNIHKKVTSRFECERYAISPGRNRLLLQLFYGREDYKKCYI